MKRNNFFVLSSVLLLLVIPGIALENVFGEKLLISEGIENTAQISAIDKLTAVETQRFSDGDLDLFLGAMDFSPDGFLIGTSSDNKIEEAITLTKLNLMIEGGYPVLSVDNLLGNDEIYCTGFSFTPEGVAYCMNGDNTLVKFDFDLETEIIVGPVIGDFNDDGIIDGDDETFGNALAVSSDGVFYFANQIGLYTLDSSDASATLVVKWDHNEDGAIDEPNAASGDNFEFGECVVHSMDFDSEGELYAILDCEGDPIFAKIGVDPSIVLGENEDEELVDMADLTLFELQRNGILDEIFEVGPFEFTDPITFSPFDFDFLLGNTYGTVSDGFDSITAIVAEDGNYIATEDAASITICDNAELELSAGAELFAECNNTSVSVDSGSVMATLQADDEEVEQLMTTLNAGDAITFDSLECELSNIGENDINVDFEGETSTISPGDTLSCLNAIDHYLGYDVKDKTRHHHDDDDDDNNNHKNSKYDVLAQKWTLTNSGEIKSELNGFCLDVEGANPNNGANVIMWPCHGNDNQKWTLTNSGEIKSELNGFCLDVEGANPNNGANVIMWPCHGNDNQKWTISSSNQIHSSLNDKCLSIEDANKKKKANVEMLTCNVGSSDNKIVVTLVDQFEESKYEVKKVKHLFNPAQVTGGEEIGSEESHLVSYDIKKIKGESKFNKIKNILVTNQFGDLTVDIKHPKKLLVPSAKSHDAVPEELEKIAINHFKCYDAKESKKTPKFEKRIVDMDDQFGSVTMEVHKVKSLCSPVDKNNEGVIDEENYLMCYDLKKIKGEPKFKKINVFTNNQFGPEELKVKKQKQLCVPSTVTLE